MSTAIPAARPLEKGGSSTLFGGWEIGLLVIMALLYLGGLYLNPAFFGSTGALFSVLRDASRYGVMAVGMTFVIVNKELDLSVGSTFGLTATIFGMVFAPTYFNMSVGVAVFWCLMLGLTIGLINGILVTVLEVPAFIATLTMLFIGRGVILGLTGGKNIAFEIKAGETSGFFGLGEINAFGFNNQILLFLLIAAVGAVTLARTSIGWTTYATGGNEQAARYAGINTRLVRMRSYILSSLCAVTAGLMNVAQSKDADPQFGLGAELIAIASVIVGGAAIFGGRGRIIGSCLGAILIGLIDKVLREGVPITRIIDVGGEKMEVAAVSQLPPGAVPAFLGVVLIIAVLIEPWLVRRRALARFWAWLRGRPPPPIPELGGVAIAGVQTRGTVAQSRGIGKRGLAAFFYRRDAAAVMLTIALWLFGLWARPDFWAGLDNTFSTLLAFSEIALLAVGLTFVMANGDIDLSVGSVLALSGAVAAVVMKDTDWGPLAAVFAGIASGVLAGAINGWLTAYVGLPAFIATLGTFYWARGVGSSIVAGTQLNGFPESFNLIGRNFYELLDVLGIAPTAGLARAVAEAVSVQTVFIILVAVVAGVALAKTPFGQMVYAIGGNERAANFAGINTRRVRFTAMVISGTCAGFAGVIYDAFYRSYIPTAGQLRELDAISSIIIGGGSIFGGYGTMIGSMAGAAVITLIRSLLSLQIILKDGSSFVLPQQWQNVFIGGILISAVVGDIWLRQNNIFSNWFGARARPGAVRSDFGERSVTIPIVEMRAIYKSFGPVQALGDVHLELMPGEVLGLVGDNSAGKSTLMKILTGAYQRDTGEIFVNGEAVRFKSPHESRDRGIEMIYQDFALCGNLDVGQNIFLGRWPLRFGLFVDRTRMHRDAREILNRLKVDVNSVYQKVESLSGGRQQSVAIARAISFNPKVVIFDEPTANLSGPATERLLETIVELKNHGVAQIIISHRLTDIFEVGDRVMVLKRGRNVGVRDVAATSEKEVLELIVSGVPETVPEEVELTSAP